MSGPAAVWLVFVFLAWLPALHAQSAGRVLNAITVDGGRYFGPFVEGRFHGKGRIEWANGAFYDGEFRDGLFSGQGRHRFANGDLYEGQFADGQMSGRGQYRSATGVTYVGDFRNDVYEGRGRFNDGNGSVYEGAFRAGLFHGRGRWTRDGLEYEGEFRRGEFSGKGELRYADGRSYRGEFLRGRMHGKGRLQGVGGDFYEGDFVKDGFTGTGIYAVPSTRMRHEGQFLNWRPDGPGQFTDGEGNRYEGQFANGEPAGRMRLVYQDGSQYEGELKGWRPHGQGELRRANGDVYRGQFAFGMFEGEGTLSYASPQADGRTQDAGLWQYGRLKQRVEDERRQARANAEAAVHAQQALLAKALGELAPRDRRRINMYLLALAGDGSQEVFRREAEFVRAQFDTEFGTRGRSLVLVNSRNTAGKLPMATVPAVRQALAAIAAKMDKERDILFLFLTSHGSKEHELSLGLPGLELPGLSATELGRALQDTGIRWKVVVISACYAGGFSDALRDSGTLIMAAAQRDRQSFGCADENDFTYFGRALFKEALPRSGSFHDAFAQAEQLIREWEERDAKASLSRQAGGAAQATQQAQLTPGSQGAQGREETSTSQGSQGAREPTRADRHSLPQIENPPAVARHLEQWWLQVKAVRAQAKPLPVNSDGRPSQGIVQ